MNWFTKIKTMCGFGENAKETSGVETPEASPDHSNMRVAELKALAKEKGVKGYYKLKKAELIEALNNS